MRPLPLLADYSVTDLTRPVVHYPIEHQTMKKFYRIFRRGRGGVYYAEEIATKRQESLKTRDRAAAEQLLNARNAAAQQPMLNLSLARVHLAAHDPGIR